MVVDIGRLTKADVARMLDYAVLDRTWPEARTLEGCANTRRYRFAAYHVLPSRLPLVVQELGAFARDEHIELGAPIAFPYGSTPTKVKLAEAEELIAQGATALDMVANMGWLKDRRYGLYEDECREHIALCHAAGINGKVIIEAGHLSDEELVAATRMVAGAGADFVKTATGTDPAGFPGFRQVRLILETLRDAHTETGLKVSGLGSPRVVTAYAFIRMGAQRIGSNAAPEIVDSLPDVQRGLFPALEGASPPGQAER
jgi:deoxyribose-phosphate aldolase